MIETKPKEFRLGQKIYPYIFLSVSFLDKEFISTNRRKQEKEIKKRRNKFLQEFFFPLLKSFDQGGNGCGPSECDNRYHSDDELLVALSKGWFNERKRCNRCINIRGNGKNVMAKVIDQCDSRMGCDSGHEYKPPYGNDIVLASKGVWCALGVPRSQWSSLDIHWSDA
ncbi:putative ripening-related protein 1 [Durio zibethinus]|uniref:Ripening-related protein 1 n=1 Tax=Durio zibethinus TaxID=66656 RepID=A0A6P6A5G2_DURZI|nr:putative ripening-related protein 1 [Durio zibethinus]